VRERRPGSGCIQGVGAFLIVGILLTFAMASIGVTEAAPWIILVGATLAGLAQFLEPEDM
jgi:hypothetical protein